MLGEPLVGPPFPPGETRTCPQRPFLAQGFSVTCRLGSGPLLLPEAGGRELWPGGRREHPLRQDGEGRSGRRRLRAGGTPNSPFPPPLFHPPLRPVPVTLFILFVGLGHFCFRFYIPHGSEITSVSTFPDLFHAARSSQDPSALLQCQRPAVPAAEQRSAARRKGGGDSPPSTGSRQAGAWPRGPQRAASPGGPLRPLLDGLAHWPRRPGRQQRAEAVALSSSARAQPESRGPKPLSSWGWPDARSSAPRRERG